MSYLALLKRTETQRAEYRDALRQWWTLADDTTRQREAEEVYQTLLRLLDDLGVAQASLIREEELRRWDEERGCVWPA